MNEDAAIQFLATSTRSQDPLARRVGQLHQALLALDGFGRLDAAKLQAIQAVLASGKLNPQQSIAAQPSILALLQDLLANLKDARRAETGRTSIDGETGPGKPGAGPLRA
jgi:hypothetical protein